MSVSDNAKIKIVGRYLYGAQIAGIQSFILTSNKLKSIIERSDIVEYLCTDAFNYDGADIITKAAGKVICFFEEKENCEKAVLEFPRKVMSMAPGITICQAVVEYKDGMTFSEAVGLLESRLRTQRNIPNKSLTTGLMGIRRERETGELSVVKDDSSKSKELRAINTRLCEKSFGKNKFKEEELTSEHSRLSAVDSWIAVVHADGNGLGSVVSKINDSPEKMKLFSEIISSASEKAANAAFDSVYNNIKISDKIQIRPIVLNGDDMTVLCRADLALPYAVAYCEAFEKEAGNLKQRLKQSDLEIDKLTASAGIAYIKDHYPYYAAYNLSESLCGVAKSKFRGVKGEMPSCVMFHKVADSFSEDYNEITERELTLPNSKSWRFGPYLLSEAGKKMDDDLWTIGDLLAEVKNVQENSALWNALRKWVSLMYDDKGDFRGRADLFLEEIFCKYGGNKNMTKGVSCVNVEGKKLVKYPTFDILNIALMGLSE